MNAEITLKGVVLPFGHSDLYKYHLEKSRSSYVEWKKFMEDTCDVDATIVPPEIIKSWQRCRDLGMDPFERPVPPILPPSRIRKLLDDNRYLIDASMPFIENFHVFVRNSHYAVCLFNQEGYLLKVLLEDYYREGADRGRMVPGAQWREETVGTSSFGMVLATGEPIHIFGAQHFTKAYHNETSSAAPIFNTRGECIGGIALVNHLCAVNPHTLGMAVAVAQAIGKDLEIREALNQEHIANAYRQAVLASVPEALIAVDTDGIISMINENALKILHLQMKPVIGEHARNVFTPENTDLFSMIESDRFVRDVELRISTDLASNDFMITSNPILSKEGRMIGKILLLQEFKRVKKLVTKFIGANPQFAYEDIWGQNPKFLNTVDRVRLASRSDSNVLLLGESGTGKDLFARAIHNTSIRKNGPFVAVNCLAIPKELIASELFGYSEGAFTGSRRGGNLGKFEVAEGGTIFLDEIADTSLEFQAMLLRVVEEKSITRLGSSSPRPVDVRIIAATNKDILQEVKKGTFRNDLYYRLNIFSIRMVPLRARLDDIPILVDRFVRKYADTMGKKIRHIDHHMIDAFMQYSWPGNVRELQNIIERMMNTVQHDALTFDLVPDEILHGQDALEFSWDDEILKQQEKTKIETMLKMMVPKKRIARTMKMARSTLYRRMKEYGLGGQ